MISAATLLLLFSSLHLIYFQVPDKKDKERVVLSFRNAVDRLTSKLVTPTSTGIQRDTAQSVNRIADYLGFLESVLGSGKQVPKEYLESVNSDVELLKSLAGQESDSEAEKKKLYEGLKELESDLTLKVTGERGSGEVARLVQVFVHSRKGAHEVGEYEVWYVPKGWASEPTVFKRFDRLTDPSNPTSMNLAPGNYYIWLRKSQPVTYRQPVSIGAYGEARREIDVALP